MSKPLWTNRRGETIRVESIPYRAKGGRRGYRFQAVRKLADGDRYVDGPDFSRCRRMCQAEELFEAWAESNGLKRMQEALAI